jgi:hypothetical protein
MTVRKIRINEDINYLNPNIDVNKIRDSIKRYIEDCIEDFSYFVRKIKEINYNPINNTKYDDTTCVLQFNFENTNYSESVGELAHKLRKLMFDINIAVLAYRTPDRTYCHYQYYDENLNSYEDVKAKYTLATEINGKFNTGNWDGSNKHIMIVEIYGLYADDIT